MKKNKTKTKDETKQLIAHVDSEIAEEFQAMLARRKQKQRYVMESLIKVWLALPVEVQAVLQMDSTTDYCSALVRGIEKYKKP